MYVLFCFEMLNRTMYLSHMEYQCFSYGRWYIAIGADCSSETQNLLNGMADGMLRMWQMEWLI